MKHVLVVYVGGKEYIGSDEAIYILHIGMQCQLVVCVCIEINVYDCICVMYL
jgi:hypothetical protein